MKRILTLFFFQTLLVALVACQEAHSVKDVLQPLPVGSIHLTGGLQDDIVNSLEHWNKSPDLPYAAFVDFFRNGRPQFALGEMWGKAVRSGSMLYRYEPDPKLKVILDATVADMLSAQRSNGSFSCVPPEMQPDNGGGDLWERKYVLLGFDEYYRYVEKDPRVLEAMIRHADCIIDQVGPAPKVPLTDLGWSPNHIESATLLEPFMRLYGWTGEQRYLDFASYIVSTGGSKGYDLFQQAFDNVPPYQMGGPYPKAYEMLSLFEGLAEYYRVTGDPHWLRCCLNLFQNVRDREITLIGNAGADQPYHPAVLGEAWGNTAVEQTNPDITRMMETCVGVTWMKYGSQLLRLTGDCSIVDEIEKYVYNGLLGAMKPEGDGFSYVNLLNGAKVTNYGWGWTFDGKPVTCCNLNGPMGLAYIPFVAVMQRADGPVVNLYNPCLAAASAPDGTRVDLIVESEFPRDGLVRIRVCPDHACRFTLGIRVPHWASSVAFRINGKPVRPDDGIWHRLVRMDDAPPICAGFRRRWKADDVLEAEFGMEGRWIPAPKGSNRAGDGFQAVQWGPIVLSRDENIDPDYDKPVRVLHDADGRVSLKAVPPTLPGTRMEFEVPVEGGTIRMVDYTSVNCWAGSHICTWLPVSDPE